jgi:hypothetical protein
MARRALFVALAAVTLVVTAASPALAHSGVNANDHLRSVVVSAPQGISASVTADGSFLTVSMSSAGPLVVLGYSGEPFLRVADGHVSHNANSLTTYDTAPGLLDSIPTTAGKGPTQWRQVTATTSYTWSDERVVWSGGALPESVMSAPRRPHVVDHWSIPVTVAGVSGAITGRVEWVPPSDSVSLTVIGVLGFLVVVLGAAALAAFPRRRRAAG